MPTCCRIVLESSMTITFLPTTVSLASFRLWEMWPPIRLRAGGSEEQHVPLAGRRRDHRPDERARRVGRDGVEPHADGLALRPEAELALGAPRRAGDLEVLREHDAGHADHDLDAPGAQAIGDPAQGLVRE